MQMIHTAHEQSYIAYAETNIVYKCINKIAKYQLNIDSNYTQLNT